MITIFIVLGLAFLVGGVGAIVDGWPYLMIERGFTQVIVGTVGATGGVILLALSWVLVELRRLRTAFRAKTLLSAATLPGEEAPPRREREEQPVPLAEPTPVEVDKTAILGPAIAGAGLAAAGGGFAAVLANDTAARERDPEPSRDVPPPLPAETLPPLTPDAPPALPFAVPPALPPVNEAEQDKTEPETTDLFDDALIASEAPDEIRNEPPEPDEPEETAQSEPLADERDEEELPAAPAALAELEPEDEPESISEAMHGAEPETPAATEPARDAPQADEPAPDMWWPKVDTPRAPAETAPAETAPVATDFDDLASLRDHLTRGPQAPGAEPPPEPEEKASDNDIAAAESWMEPAFGRREPTFARPAEEPTDTALPDEEPVETQAAREDEMPADRPVVGPNDEAVPAEEEPASGEAAAKPDEASRPAASDEGVVGAYQVGDTHFTMFADGSIRARTPDGEYSFASMEELKAYLASEKSRLGV